MNEQNKLYLEMWNALHKYLNNHGNDEDDWNDFLEKMKKYKEFLKNE